MGEIDDQDYLRDFPGFYPPRYTPIPDQLLDDVMAFLSGAELKVLLYIMRHTFGYKREGDHLSAKQIAEGIAAVLPQVSDVNEVIQQRRGDAPVTVVIVRSHRHGLLVDAADCSRYGNVVAIMEGNAVADLEVEVRRSFGGGSWRWRSDELDIGLRRCLQIDRRVGDVGMAQIERRIVDRHAVIVHRHDAPGMESAGIAAEEPDHHAKTQVNTNGKNAPRLGVQRPDHVFQTVQVQ